VKLAGLSYPSVVVIDEGLLLEAVRDVTEAGRLAHAEM
jgi:hypothetical protein